MTASLNKKNDNTLELTIVIPYEEVKRTEEEIVNATVKNTSVAGFRKGKAPKKLVEENIDKAKVKEEVLKKLLPEAYIQAVKEHKLNPIVNPRVHIEKMEDGKDLTIIAETCEAPEVKLKDYKESVQKATAGKKIIIPGKEPQEPKLEDIIKALLESVEVVIPQMLIDFEVERLLSQTLDEIKKLGLTLDQYLASTGRTPESLRGEYQNRAINDMKMEFALAKVAETESIKVEPKEIEEAILKAKDEKERENLEKNKYLLASILRQQKTLDFLKNL